MSSRIHVLLACALALAVACGDSETGGNTGDASGPGMNDRDGGKDRDDAGRDPHQRSDAGMGMDGGPDDPDGGVQTTKKVRVVSSAPTYAIADDSYGYTPKTNQSEQTEWKVKEGPSGMKTEEDGTKIGWEPTKEQGGEHRVTITSKVKGEDVDQTTYVTVGVPKKEAEGTASPKEGGAAVVNSPTSTIQGATVKASPGTVKSSTKLTISELDKGPKMASTKGETKAVDFGPNHTVFARPALVALPLPEDVVLDAARVGAFIYNPKGRWERARVVRKDLLNRLVYAHAPHFTILSGAQSAQAFDLLLTRMSATSACEGQLTGYAGVIEKLSEFDSDVVNNPSDAIRALRDGGADDLERLISSEEFVGSLRFVRVIQLVQGEGEEQVTLETQVLVTTLFAPGDGSATIRFTDALGNLVEDPLSIASLRDEIDTVGALLLDSPVRAIFASDADTGLGLAARLHVLYFEGDASLDAASVEDLGGAAVDTPADELSEPELEKGSLDLDCDGVVSDYDTLDSRSLPGIDASPSDVASAVVGAKIRLSAKLVNASKNAKLSWQLLGGNGALETVGDDANARDFSAEEPGRYLVEVSASLSTGPVSYLFVIDVVEPAALPACAPSAEITTIKVGDTLALIPVLGESDVPESALTVQWGFVSEDSLVTNEQLGLVDGGALFVPSESGSFTIGCRVSDGTRTGATGALELGVVEQDQNRVPVDLVLSPTSATILVNESLTLTAAATDLDEDPLTFSWSSSGGELGTASSGDGESTDTFSSSAPGLFTISVTVDDGSGLYQEVTASILVIESATDLDGNDVDDDGWPASLDCDDTNPARNPGLYDACDDDIDDDCVDGPRTSDCDDDGQSVEQGDCDDRNASVNTSAVEHCDGVDNDCNGQDDDGFGLEEGCTLGVGACAVQGAVVCTPDGAASVCTGTAGAPGIEACDGIDNDCDGSTDEGYVPSPTTCGLGVCASTGTKSCEDGQEVDSCVPGKSAANDTSCNGDDDDCDGDTDEDYVSGESECGEGACASTGTKTCVQGVEIDSCVIGTPASNDATCDGDDDDCDGDTDEDYVSGPTTCGRGVCASTGTKTCVDGAEQDSCTEGTPAESDSTCDGDDEDCDGDTDEDYAATETTCGVGACASTGTTSCVNGEVDDSCAVQPQTGDDSDCDGVDDDCDEAVDEAYVSGPTTCGRGVCASAGTKTCVDGAEQDSCTEGTPAESDSTCDGDDDDCDGDTDEDYPSSSTLCGVGACASTGTETCSGGEVVDSCTEGTPAVDDSDCDGVDDDCDEAVDEEYEPEPSSCGIGVCASTGSKLCSEGEISDTCQIGEQQAISDATCDGLDDDCDGAADDDVIVLEDVCNGLDDDCDGSTDDGVSCEGGVSGCTEGPEVCNALDDDCDGFADENNVCNMLLEAGSLEGVWWDCTDPTCTDTAESGVMFAPGGQLIGLGVFDGEPYQPGDGPYCRRNDDTLSWSVEGTLLTITGEEDGEPMTATAELSFAGNIIQLDWIILPPDGVEESTMKRVPEQPGGACPAECQASEFCENGVDDDCDGKTDQEDDNCGSGCQGDPSGEICDGVDNDCDGVIDDLSHQDCVREDAQGICRQGHMVCSGLEPVCEAGSPDAQGEVCPDGIDNDCDGEVDEPDCAPLTAGETCFNAIDVSTGGVFEVDPGERNDLAPACLGTDARDRMFSFTVPQGPGTEFVIRLTRPSDMEVGAMLQEAPAGWEPGMACPAIGPETGICIFGNVFQQYLSGGKTYLLVVDTQGGDKPTQPGGPFRLSIARRNDGICSPGDLDDDGSTICAGDCDETSSDTHPGAFEQCNQLDDDCDGIVDEQEGTCPTGLNGVCGVGRNECGATPSCQPIQTASPADYCDDGADNDCNGLADDDCVNDPGEACTNAIDVGVGGTFFGDLAAANDDARSGCGFQGREIFYRFTVPAGGAELHFMPSFGDKLQYVLYRDCELEALSCFVPMNQFLQGGDYVLAVELAAGEELPPVTSYRFSIGLSVSNECLTPDFDGDGEAICDGDCDETDDSVNSEAGESETCDGIDNDCNGQIDDLSTECLVSGQQGVCAVGKLHCTEAGPFCEQTSFGDPLGRDFCGDGLDNDCDGGSDEDDPESCVAVLPGDVCSLATDVSAGGVFPSTLEGYGDDADAGCGDGMGPGPSGRFERFYTFTLSEQRVVNFAARVPPLLDTYIGLGVRENCETNVEGPLSCGIGQFAALLDPGTYVLFAFGDQEVPFELVVSSHLPGDPSGTSCIPADLDGDEFTLCNGDCNESDPFVHAGSSEQCNGIDDDCNGFADDGIPTEPCLVEGAEGECQFGELTCSSGEPACTPFVEPGDLPELCNDGVDQNCNGVADDQGTPGVDCVIPDGESCSTALPIRSEYVLDTLSGANHEGGGCYGGVNGDAPEKYYRFEAEQTGWFYVNVVPRGPGPVPEFAMGVFTGACGDPASLACFVSQQGVFFVNQPGPQFIVVESDAPFDYELQFGFLEGGVCMPGDMDEDGFSLCGGDCDDSDGRLNSEAEETCDNVDNNCNGVIDDVDSIGCDTGDFGICAAGFTGCADGKPACLPIRTALPNDICGDDLDNDCDGDADESGCTELPQGETCELAEDASRGGVFDGTLIEATDDGPHCSIAGAADRYYVISLDETAELQVDVKAAGDPGPEPLFFSVHLFQDCSAPIGFFCGSPRIGPWTLEPGTYLLAVEANRPVDYRLFVAFGTGTTCMVGGEPGGDFDEDGVTLCENDCDEGNFDVHPGAPEQCENQLDDDCDGQTDSLPFTPCETSEPGDCRAGRLDCPAVGSVPVCIPMVTPGSQLELCDDDIDQNCNGDGDDKNPALCTVATGDRCDLAISLDDELDGSIDDQIKDPSDDAFGCGSTGSAEKVYRIRAPESGNLYMNVVPFPASPNQFTLRYAQDNCAGPGICIMHGTSFAVMEAGKTYFITIEGPVDVPYRFMWAFETPGGTCQNGLGGGGEGDFDGDRVALCNFDCNDASSQAFPGALEICGNFIDDNCDSITDTVSGSCETGLPGLCGMGQLECQASGAPACVPNEPMPEVCNAFDDDCDGQIDDEGACGTGCGCDGGPGCTPGCQCDPGCGGGCGCDGGPGCTPGCQCDPECGGGCGCDGGPGCTPGCQCDPGCL